METNWKKLDNKTIYQEFEACYHAIPQLTDTVSAWEAPNGVVMLSFAVLEQFPFVKQGFSTRVGGVSTGIYSSMNLTFGKDDDKQKVTENFRRVGEALNIRTDRMVYSKQTHTCNVKCVDDAHCGMGVTRPADYSDVDALVTASRDVCLVTAYADCIPVIAVDPVTQTIGAAHAGWRGTVGKIAVRMIDVFCAEYGAKPADIYAFVGPGICKDCYEVGKDVATHFLNAYSEKEAALILHAKEAAGKFSLNLPMANVMNLKNAGLLLEHIAVSDICTCCNCAVLFSHRATHGKQGILCNFISLTS